MYSETTLFVTANSTHVVLEQNPHCYVVCSLKSEGNGQTKDNTRAALQQKYHRHLNEIYGKILSSFEAEIDLLQSIAVYSVRNMKLTEHQDKNDLDICTVFPGELLTELGLYEENFSVSRFHLSEFLGKHVDSYVKVSTEYRRIVNVVDKSCKDVQSNYLETIYSEHIALKQHIHSQVRAFVKGRAVLMDDPWKVLCISTTNCMNVARTVEEWVARNLTDLEASYFVREIHNALARFTNGLCNKGMIACQSVNLITSNDLQIFLTSIKTKRSGENLTAINAGYRFSVEMSNNNHVRSQRKKRWVFTNFLAAITGLANEDEVQKLDKAAENLRHVELDNAGEIIKLEGKSNEIISRISKQSEQLAKLYHDRGYFE
jgi:hypothetical protein